MRGVIFDLGGTLIHFDGDSQTIAAEGTVDLAAFLVKQGLAVREKAFASAFFEERERAAKQAEADGVERTAEMTLRRTLAAFGYPQMDDNLLTRGVKIFFRPEERGWRVYPDAIPTLQRLSETGYRLALISNATDDPLIQRILDRLGFRPWLSPAITSAGVGIRKPDPGIFRLVLDEWGLPAESCVMVGDYLWADIHGAHRAGMPGVLVTMREQPANAQYARAIVPEAQVSCLAELPKLIAAL